MRKLNSNWLLDGAIVSSIYNTYIGTVIAYDEDEDEVNVISKGKVLTFGASGLDYNGQLNCNSRYDKYIDFYFD